MIYRLLNYPSSHGPLARFCPKSPKLLSLKNNFQTERYKSRDFSGKLMQLKTSFLCFSEIPRGTDAGHFIIEGRTPPDLLEEKWTRAQPLCPWYRKSFRAFNKTNNWLQTMENSLRTFSFPVLCSLPDFSYTAWLKWAAFELRLRIILFHQSNLNPQITFVSKKNF